MRDKILSYVEDNTKFLEPDMFDEAILGVAEQCGMQAVVAYDRQVCIEVLMRMDMDRDEAEEYFEFNVAGAHMGDGTPVFIDRRYAE
jgi:hypothetical protein